MFIYNVHAPHKTFALAAKANENSVALIERIITKASLLPAEAEVLRARRDGAGIVYEFEGERWALEDDDDLAIVNERFRADAETMASPSITLHINLPHSNGIMHHTTSFNGPPPSFVSASAQLQARTEKKKKSQSSRSGSRPASAAGSVIVASTVPSLPSSPLAASRVEHVHYVPPPSDPLTAANHLGIPNSEKMRSRSAQSMRSGMSTRSRRSKWGDDDAEPLGDTKRRQFNEFHASNGVRTVVGKVGNVDNVRMLLKSGYRHVYISRSFAMRHRLISSKQSPGFGGYSGLQILGQVPITIGSRTGIHTAMLSEEQHFDVVLGRAWLEKMNIKVDPLDQTLLTYMDSGETIPCDLVVLRDAKGEVITIT